MDKQHPLQGTKIAMRRLFKYDIKEIMECFADYDGLFFNPVTTEFVGSIFLCGEFWGAFAGDTIVAAAYIHPFDCEISRREVRYSLLCDFIYTPSQYLSLGYIGFHRSNIEKLIAPGQQSAVKNGLYSGFLNIAEMQAFRQGYSRILHCMPLKTGFDLAPLFAGGFSLVKLRGLEKLVVHYIFCKDIFARKNSIQKGESTAVALGNTKALSAFLENEYYGCDILKDGSETVLLLKQSVTD